MVCDSQAARSHWDEVRKPSSSLLYVLLFAGGILTLLGASHHLSNPSLYLAWQQRLWLGRACGITVTCFSAIYLLKDLLTRAGTRTRCRDDVKSSLAALLRNYEDLRSFLADVDDRTRDYFHCVTNTKMTCYFYLFQIQHELEKATTEIARLAESRSLKNLLAAHEKLQGPFTYFEAFMADTGTTRTLPLSHLPDHIAGLRQQLASGIEDLEEDLRSWRQQSGVEDDSRQ